MDYLLASRISHRTGIWSTRLASRPGGPRPGAACVTTNLIYNNNISIGRLRNTMDSGSRDEVCDDIMHAVYKLHDIFRSTSTLTPIDRGVFLAECSKLAKVARQLIKISLKIESVARPGGDLAL